MQTASSGGGLHVCMEASTMKAGLPVLLILLGTAEIICAFMNLKFPLPIALILGAIFIGLGVKALIDAKTAK